MKLLQQTIEKCPLFSQVVPYLFRARQGSVESGSPSQLLHRLMLLLTVNFSFDFGKVFFKLYPTSRFAEKGSFHNDELAKAIDVTLSCKSLLFFSKRRYWLCFIAV